ncbi:septin-4 [Terrapene carolina triunguis]|nr:septin-4 [Terrapene carolina triunguis]
MDSTMSDNHIRDLPPRALAKFGPESTWWSLLQPDSQAPAWPGSSVWGDRRWMGLELSPRGLEDSEKEQEDSERQQEPKKELQEKQQQHELGIQCPRQQLLQNFYWPRVCDAVQQNCRSCDPGQRVGRAWDKSEAPLRPLTIIEEPFQKVAMDIVGSLSKATRLGKKYILVVMDFATRYPEAVALSSTESNGLVERFYGTLRMMLRTLMDQHPQDWDKYLPHLRYREVPQEPPGVFPFELLYGRRVRGPLDLGDRQVPVGPDARLKSAFTTPLGLFEFLVVPFDLKGASATSQRRVGLLLKGMENLALAYIDDICVFSQTWEEHVSQVKRVLGCLKEAGLMVNAKKCKVEMIRDWPVPQTKKQVQAFIGMTGCYRRFVPHVSPLAAPSLSYVRGHQMKGADAELRVTETPGQRMAKVKMGAPNQKSPNHSPPNWSTGKRPNLSLNPRDLTDEMYTDILWWLRDEEIKRFLKGDSEEAELAQFLKEFPSGESFRKVELEEGKRAHGQGPVDPGVFSSVAQPIADELLDEKELRPFSRPRPLDFQQHIAAPAPLSPSRPRSPWGKLDPYDSSEDDKEYVGFATLPNQVHRKSVKKGFDFTLMVAGESGLGKSTLVNSLFLTDMYRDRKLLSAEERITQTVEITKHVVDIEEKGIKLRLTIVDTPGFGDAVNNTECWKPVADYIDQQFEQYFRDESGLNRKNIQDNRVHCCLYFISPFGHGLRPLDVEFMRALHQRVNIVPILAKADTLTPSEVERKKSKIREEIEHYGIRIYQFPECDSDEDEDFKLQDQALKESIPFAVIGSNTVVEAKGRRVRGRLYPWGIVEVENPAHCDFVKLRTMLVKTHMQDLKDVTRETHYENYRAQCIQSMTRMVVKERNRNKLTRESGTDFPIPAIPAVPDSETEKLIREKDEELRRMQEMLQKIQRQMKDSH